MADEKVTEETKASESAINSEYSEKIKKAFKSNLLLRFLGPDRLKRLKDPDTYSDSIFFDAIKELKIHGTDKQRADAEAILGEDLRTSLKKIVVLFKRVHAELDDIKHTRASSKLHNRKAIARTEDKRLRQRNGGLEAFYQWLNHLSGLYAHPDVADDASIEKLLKSLNDGFTHPNTGNRKLSHTDMSGRTINSWASVVDAFPFLREITSADRRVLEYLVEASLDFSAFKKKHKDTAFQEKNGTWKKVMPAEKPVKNTIVNRGKPTYGDKIEGPKDVGGDPEYASVLESVPLLLRYSVSTLQRLQSVYNQHLVDHEQYIKELHDEGKGEHEAVQTEGSTIMHRHMLRTFLPMEKIINPKKVKSTLHGDVTYNTVFEKDLNTNDFVRMLTEKKLPVQRAPKSDSKSHVKKDYADTQQDLEKFFLTLKAGSEDLVANIDKASEILADGKSTIRPVITLDYKDKLLKTAEDFSHVGDSVQKYKEEELKSIANPEERKKIEQSYDEYLDKARLYALGVNTDNDEGIIKDLVEEAPPLPGKLTKKNEGIDLYKLVESYKSERKDGIVEMHDDLEEAELAIKDAKEVLIKVNESFSSSDDKNLHKAKLAHGVVRKNEIYRAIINNWSTFLGGTLYDDIEEHASLAQRLAPSKDMTVKEAAKKEHIEDMTPETVTGVITGLFDKISETFNELKGNIIQDPVYKVLDSFNATGMADTDLPQIQRLFAGKITDSMIDAFFKHTETLYKDVSKDLSDIDENIRGMFMGSIKTILPTILPKEKEEGKDVSKSAALRYASALISTRSILPKSSVVSELRRLAKILSPRISAVETEDKVLANWFKAIKSQVSVLDDKLGDTFRTIDSTYEHIVSNEEAADNGKKRKKNVIDVNEYKDLFDVGRESLTYDLSSMGLLQLLSKANTPKQGQELAGVLKKRYRELLSLYDDIYPEDAPGVLQAVVNKVAVIYSTVYGSSLIDGTIKMKQTDSAKNSRAHSVLDKLSDKVNKGFDNASKAEAQISTKYISKLLPILHNRIDNDISSVKDNILSLAKEYGATIIREKLRAIEGSLKKLTDIPEHSNPNRKRLHDESVDRKKDEVAKIRIELNNELKELSDAGKSEKAMPLRVRHALYGYEENLKTLVDKRSAISGDSVANKDLTSVLKEYKKDILSKHPDEAELSKEFTDYMRAESDEIKDKSSLAKDYLDSVGEAHRKKIEEKEDPGLSAEYIAKHYTSTAKDLNKFQETFEASTRAPKGEEWLPPTTGFFGDLYKAVEDSDLKKGSTLPDAKADELLTQLDDPEVRDKNKITKKDYSYYKSFIKAHSADSRLYSEYNANFNDAIDIIKKSMEKQLAVHNTEDLAKRLRDGGSTLKTKQYDSLKYIMKAYDTFEGLYHTYAGEDLLERTPGLKDDPAKLKELIEYKKSLAGPNGLDTSHSDLLSRYMKNKHSLTDEELNALLNVVDTYPTWSSKILSMKASTPAQLDHILSIAKGSSEDIVKENVKSKRPDSIKEELPTYKKNEQIRKDMQRFMSTYIESGTPRKDTTSAKRRVILTKEVKKHIGKYESHLQEDLDEAMGDKSFTIADIENTEKVLGSLKESGEPNKDKIKLYKSALVSAKKQLGKEEEVIQAITDKIHVDKDTLFRDALDWHERQATLHRDKYKVYSGELEDEGKGLPIDPGDGIKGHVHGKKAEEHAKSAEHMRSHAKGEDISKANEAMSEPYLQTGGRHGIATAMMGQTSLQNKKPVGGLSRMMTVDGGKKGVLHIPSTVFEPSTNDQIFVRAIMENSPDGKLDPKVFDQKLKQVYESYLDKSIDREYSRPKLIEGIRTLRHERSKWQSEVARQQKILSDYKKYGLPVIEEAGNHLETMNNEIGTRSEMNKDYAEERSKKLRHHAKAQQKDQADIEQLHTIAQKYDVLEDQKLAYENMRDTGSEAWDDETRDALRRVNESLETLENQRVLAGGAPTAVVKTAVDPADSSDNTQDPSEWITSRGTGDPMANASEGHNNHEQGFDRELDRARKALVKGYLGLTARKKGTKTEKSPYMAGEIPIPPSITDLVHKLKDLMNVHEGNRDSKDLYDNKQYKELSDNLQNQYHYYVKYAEELLTIGGGKVKRKDLGDMINKLLFAYSDVTRQHAAMVENATKMLKQVEKELEERTSMLENVRKWESETGYKREKGKPVKGGLSAFNPLEVKNFKNMYISQLWNRLDSIWYLLESKSPPMAHVDPDTYYEFFDVAKKHLGTARSNRISSAIKDISEIMRGVNVPRPDLGAGGKVPGLNKPGETTVTLTKEQRASLLAERSKLYQLANSYNTKQTLHDVITKEIGTELPETGKSEDRKKLKELDSAVTKTEAKIEEIIGPSPRKSPLSGVPKTEYPEMGTPVVKKSYRQDKSFNEKLLHGTTLRSMIASLLSKGTIK